MSSLPYNIVVIATGLAYQFSKISAGGGGFVGGGGWWSWGVGLGGGGGGGGGGRKVAPREFYGLFYAKSYQQTSVKISSIK